MTSYQRFTIDKTLQPFGDALILHGLARLLAHLGVAPDSMILRDQGMAYTIDLNPPITEAIFERWEDAELIPFVLTPKNGKELADAPNVRQINYEEEKRLVDEGFAVQPPRSPKPEWAIYRAINPGALPGYNTLVLNWHTARSPETLRLLFDLFSDSPNDVDGAAEAWTALDKAHGWGIKADTTGLQLFNPDQGKGNNRPKPDGINENDKPKTLWLIEYLKAAGFYAGAITRTMRGSKDRKTLVVVPRALTYSENKAINDEFALSMQLPLYPTQFDILAIIRYTRSLITHTIAQPGRYRLRGNRSRVKQRLVAGFQTAFYKDLGNAVATMNLSFLGLPGWVTITSPEEVELYTHPETGLLVEFEKFVRQFDEHESDVPELLRPLRDFVSGDDLTALFRFTNAFPAYLIGRRERNKPAKALSTELIERIVMNQNDAKYREILAAPGFQNIAYAIRQSTITAQYYKKKGSRKYEVRYGLGQELARKSRYPGDFITALTDFLHRYNAENAQVKELRPAPYRTDVYTTDIEEIVALIDQYGSETVANLLIAYGYARVPREDADENESQFVAENAEQGGN